MEVNGGGVIILGTVAGNELVMEALDSPEQAREFVASLRVLIAEVEEQAVILEQQRKATRSTEVLTPEDIARELQIRPKSAQEMCRSNQFPGAYKIGKKLWRISRADFDRWKEDQKTKRPSREPADTVEAPWTVETSIRRRA